jgi:hypothetical protein
MEKCAETNDRKRLFGYLDDIIALSHGKATTERGNKDQSKQGWARVLISAIATYGDLLKDVELDDLKQEIEEIKEVLEHEHKPT